MTLVFEVYMTEKPEYALCSDGVYRQVHLPNCDCDDCWEYRALITRRRDGETMDYYKKDFEGLTEQECFDLLQKWDEDPMNKSLATYSSWRAGLRARAATASNDR
jgi:hypothetical protein